MGIKSQKKMSTKSQQRPHTTTRIKKLWTWTRYRIYNSCVGTPRSTWGWRSKVSGSFMCEG